MNPKVSVIVPNYNHSRYLNVRIDSILSQTFQDFELIILDDCSTDNSKEIIDAYSNDNHVSHVIMNNANSGNTFLQWNKGVGLAQGDYIWIAESDDVAHPEFLQTLVPLLERTSNAVIAFSHSYLIDAEGNDLNINRHEINDRDTFVIYDGKKFAYWAMLTRNDIYNASMVVFKRSVFNKISKSYIRYRSCGDWYIWMNVCLQGRVVEVNRQLNYYRQHPNKVTVNANKNDADLEEVASLLNEFALNLHFGRIMWLCFRGRWTRDINEMHRSNKAAIIAKYPKVFGATRLQIILYKIIQKLFRVFRY